MTLRDFTAMMYYLKRAYSVGAQLCQPSESSVDRTIGLATTTITRFNIDRLVVLPKRSLFHASNLAVKVGGNFQIGDKELVLDKGDISVIVDLTSYFLIYARKYNIIDFVNYEQYPAYYLHVRETKGELPLQDITVGINQFNRGGQGSIPINELNEESPLYESNEYKSWDEFTDPDWSNLQ